MSKKILLLGLIIVSFFSFAFSTGVQRVAAQGSIQNIVEKPVRIPFGGRFEFVEVCANGIMFTMILSKFTVFGFFMMTWDAMIPIPFLGQGLYQWWAIIPGNLGLGSAVPIGLCIIPIFPIPIIPFVIPTSFSAVQMGTSLIFGI